MKQFCYWHIKVVEIPDGTACSAHLDEGRCFQCPYTKDDIQYGSVFTDKSRLYISKTKGDPFNRACQDFEPRKGTVRGLIRELQKAFIS